jgi:hypothetical protein
MRRPDTGGLWTVGGIPDALQAGSGAIGVQVLVASAEAILREQLLVAEWMGQIQALILPHAETLSGSFSEVHRVMAVLRDRCPKLQQLVLSRASLEIEPALRQATGGSFVEIGWPHDAGNSLSYLVWRAEGGSMLWSDITLQGSTVRSHVGPEQVLGLVTASMGAGQTFVVGQDDVPWRDWKEECTVQLARRAWR